MTVKRYDQIIHDGVMEPISDGKYVTYSDYQKLVAENAAYKSAEIMEFLRLIECMIGDYNNSNYGDAQGWIRHVAKASGDFEDKHGDSPWGRMNGLAVINTDAAIAELKAQGVDEFSSEIGKLCSELKLGSMSWKAAKSIVMRAVTFSANLRAGVKS